jgi:ribokinase
VTAVAGPSRVVVVGSANLDHVCRVARMPAAGETTLAESYAIGLGGKGMNQAVAASLLGGDVALVAAVGDDDGAGVVRAGLAAAGVDSTHVRTCPGRATGAAFVTVAASGENSIVVASGANSEVSPADVRAALAERAAPTVIVAQLEVPVDAVAAAAAAARPADRLVLNLAPFRPVPAAVLELADPLVVNEPEARLLLGSAATAGGADDLGPVAEALARRCRSVVITAGARGAVAVDATGEPRWHRAPAVSVLDTTGAGDAFVGALAVVLAQRRPLHEAAAVAVVAASASVQFAGAQSAYPHMVAAVRSLDRLRARGS